MSNIVYKRQYFKNKVDIFFYIRYLKEETEELILIKTRSLKYFIKDAGFKTQATFADALGMDKVRVNKIINNKADGFNSKTLNKLCSILECQPGDILEYRPD